MENTLSQTKICYLCKQILPVNKYGKNLSTKDGLMRKCRDCKRLDNKKVYQQRKNDISYKEQTRSRKKQIRDWFKHFKSTKLCTICSENHPACLQFHHVDESQKKLEISAMVLRGNSIEQILLEIEKCIVVCANCHFKLHYKE